MTRSLLGSDGCTTHLRWWSRTGVQAAITGLLLLLILLARRPESFLHPQFWAEDGSIFFVQADLDGLRSLVEPFSGYHLFLLRLIAASSAVLDARWVPAAYFSVSMAATLGIALAAFSPRVDLPCRPACVLSLGLVPHTGEVLGNLTNLQWITALALVWLLLARDGTNLRQQATDVFVAFIVGLTGTFSILFAVLFIWRAWRRKTSASAIVAAVIALTASIQFWTVLNAPPDPTQDGSPSVQMIAWVIGLRLPACLLLPPVWVEKVPRAVLMWLGAATIAALLAVALVRGPRRDFRLGLVACIAVVLAATIYRVRCDLGVFGGLVNGDRYFFVPKVLTAWLLISGWSGRRCIRWTTVAATGMMLIATSAQWRYERLVNHHWDDYARRIEAGESVQDIPVNPGMTFGHPGRHRK